MEEAGSFFGPFPHFWIFLGLADQSQFSMWLHHSCCEHNTSDVWTCLASGSKSRGLCHTTGRHWPQGAELPGDCKQNKHTWDSIYLPFQEIESNSGEHITAQVVSSNAYFWSYGWGQSLPLHSCVTRSHFSKMRYRPVNRERLSYEQLNLLSVGCCQVFLGWRPKLLKDRA